MDLGLRGRTAFVAAASSGLGRAVATALAEEGADVGICARRQPLLEEVATTIRAAGVRAVPSVADVTDQHQVQLAIDRTVQRTGRLDVLVVNAGGPPAGTFQSIDDSTWEASIQLTLMSAVWLTRAALPHLRRSDAAAVVVLSSTSVPRPMPSLLLSNALRAAVEGMARTLAAELAPQVRVNSIHTARIRTTRTEELTRHSHPGMDVEEALASQAAAIPLRRFGDPAELARVAVFLASPAASYVTGTAVDVDGGITGAAL